MALGESVAVISAVVLSLLEMVGDSSRVIDIDTVDDSALVRESEADRAGSVRVDASVAAVGKRDSVSVGAAGDTVPHIEAVGVSECRRVRVKVRQQPLMT